MREYTNAELSYLIQEGQAANAEAREALVRAFASPLLAFAAHLSSSDEDPEGSAFALTALSFHRALSNPENVHHFDSLQNWLFSEMLRAHGAQRGKRDLLDHVIKNDESTILLLRYGFRLPTTDLAEITGKDENKTISTLRQARRRYLNRPRLPGKQHLLTEIEDAVDGQVSWQSFSDDQSHMNECPDCRRYLGEIQDLEKQLTGAFENIRPESLHEKTLDRLLAFIREDPENIRIKPQRRRPVEALWLFGALTLFFVAALALNPFWTPPQPTPAPTPTLPPPENLTDQVRSIGYSDLERALLFSPVPIWEPGAIQLSDWTPSTRVVFSLDGAFAAFGAGKTIILIDLARSTQIQLDGHAQDIQSLAFADHHWLASADTGGAMRIWDIQQRGTRYVLSEDVPVRTFDFSTDGELIAAASEDTLTIWKFSGPDLIRLNQIPLENAVLLSISDDNSRLAVVDKENIITVWQLSDFSLLLRFEAGNSLVEKIQFSPNGNRLAVANDSGRVHIYGFSQPIGGKFDGIRIFVFDHTGTLLDFNWTNDDHYLAILEQPVPDEPPVVLIREMTTGLPAALPFIISDRTSIDTFAITDDGALIAADPNGLLAFPATVSPLDHPLPTEFNMAKTNVFPVELPAQKETDPFLKDYPDTFENVAEQIAPEIPLVELIPAEYAFTGASFDPVRISASFTFTRTLAPSRDAIVLLKIRPRSNGESLTEMEDWIGAGADFTHIQIGKHLGERVTGTWEMSAIDQGAPGIYRWTPGPLTRFRWTQGGYLFELISASTLSTESGRWHRLFQPLAIALISLDEENPTLRYIVEDGDTCTSIAARFGASIGILITLNNLDRNCNIFVGDALTIPVPPPVGIFSETDLDCDGSPEQLRLIPDPQQPNTDVYFGFVIDALPEGGRVGTPQFATFDQLSISDLAVDFFGPPQLINIENACGKLIAVTGYGGSGEDSGLRFLLWTGESLRLVLDTDGFPDEAITETITGGYTFTTQRLTYAPSQAACTLNRKTFTWNNNAFAVTGEETTFGVDCFENSLP